ncbi:YopX family protein [Listeria seeligeri]|uniref:YopX family protein n=1 Tax=Listeria seeligeri TaxID=1640 RepID=UPI0022EBD6F5|nr:YopX family protein [Listeria seeligeri]
MRPIEFKAQNVNGAWVCGNLSILKKKIGNVAAGSYISNSAGAPFAYKVRPETVSQFIGLTDKNGKKIFEGDIGWDEHNECYGVVKFEEGKFLYVWENIAEDLREVADSIEIYGNIHENPESLGVSE